MRKKQSKPSKSHGKYKVYAPEKLKLALDDVRRGGVSIHKAALEYGIPYMTLADRVRGRVDPETTLEKLTILTKEEELRIVEEAERSAKLGYGYTNRSLQKLAGEIAFKFKRRSTDKPLSNCWLYGFLKRWSFRVSTFKPAALEASRAKNTTPEILDSYFTNLYKTLIDNELQDKPSMIYNMDETAISPEHRPPNIIAPTDGKAQAITSPRSGSTTLIGCANASGNHIPPYFVFKGKRINDELMKGTSPGSRYIMSDSGWSTTQVFKDYLENHFMRHVTREPDQPVILILDGHSTHTSRQMIEWALEKKIILFILPAHTSHVLQPLDVAVFGPFKRFYYSECASYMKSNMGKVVTRYDMSALACKAYLKAMNPWNIVSAFKKTGIFPMDKGAVPQEKLLPCEAFRDQNPTEKLKAMEGGSEAIDAYLQSKRDNQCTIVASPPCKCKLKRNKKKPNPSGREITSQVYLEEINNYEDEKENRRPDDSLIPESQQQSTPRPCTSGIITITDCNKESSPLSSEDEEDTDVCCVYNRFSPPNLNEKPHLKIVSWGQCDNCGHWVHLVFCHMKRVIRRGDEFLCAHCQ